VRSARAMRPLALGACLCLLGAGAAGCSTTQEKAAHQKVKAEHILKAQAERKKAKAAKEKARAKKHHKKEKGK
jgi:hypothetical protein